jgi:hypothetical protein
MRPAGGRSRDLEPDWDRVCRVAAAGVPGLSAEALMERLAGRADSLRRMPERARALGVPDAVISGAMGFCDRHADGLEALARGRRHAEG